MSGTPIKGEDIQLGDHIEVTYLQARFQKPNRMTKVRFIVTILEDNCIPVPSYVTFDFDKHEFSLLYRPTKGVPG